MFIPQEESDNGDGRYFLSVDGRARLAVWGNHAMDESLEDCFRRDATPGGDKTITYKVLKKGYYVVSGYQGKRIYYQKTLLRGSTFATFVIDYEVEVKATYNAVTEDIAKSFR